MIGGFLGAGKTTAIVRLARYFSDRGLRVGQRRGQQALLPVARAAQQREVEPRDVDFAHRVACGPRAVGVGRG
ncbi:MAG: hypothetical protein ACK44W_01005, partial [Planctomycetota bacterium]